MKTRNIKRGLSVSTAIAGSSSATNDDVSQDHINHDNSQMVTLHGGHSDPPSTPPFPQE